MTSTIPQVNAEVQRRIAGLTSASTDEIIMRLLEAVTRQDVKLDYLQLSLDEHRKDDKEKLSAISAKMEGISSSVVVVKSDRDTLFGIWKGAVFVIVGLAGLIDLLVRIVEHFKP